MEIHGYCGNLPVHETKFHINYQFPLKFSKLSITLCKIIALFVVYEKTCNGIEIAVYT